MATTLTREIFREKTSKRYEEVKVPGFGIVGIRDLGEFKRSHRISTLFDDNGKLVEDEHARRRAYSFIDQLMIDKDTPMFEASDLEWLMEQAGSRMDPLAKAIRDFNGEEDLGNEDESSDFALS